MKDQVVWRLYRDTSKRPLAQKLIDLVKLYKAKMRHDPNMIGLPPSYGDESVNVLQARFKVLVCVPAWAGSEIWLGRDDRSITGSGPQSGDG